jgi:upstream activation factor subunit UAF30
LVNPPESRFSPFNLQLYAGKFAPFRRPRTGSPFNEPEIPQGRFWLISSRVVLYSLPMANESKAKSAFMKPVQPDAALSKIVGANPLPRTELTKKLWEYIKQNKLQDKKLIKADEALETVFNGKKEVDMFELTRLVNTHIIK